MCYFDISTIKGLGGQIEDGKKIDPLLAAGIILSEITLEVTLEHCHKAGETKRLKIALLEIEMAHRLPVELDSDKIHDRAPHKEVLIFKKYIYNSTFFS